MSTESDAWRTGGEVFGVINETREFVVEGGASSMSRTIPFHDQGCKYCREFWISTSDEPKLIGVSLDHQCHLYRCGICSSWWEYGLNYPHVIDDELAARIATTIASTPS